MGHICSNDSSRLPSLVVSISITYDYIIAIQFVIRGYKNKDFEEVWQLHEKAFEGTTTFLGHGPWDEDLKNIFSVYENNGGAFFVMELLEENMPRSIVGMGAIRKVSSTTAEIKRMRILPEFQGQGLGTQMLLFLENQAKQLGYQELLLDTTVHQKPAVRLYQKNGYVEYRRAMEHGMETMFMRKNI